MRGQTGGSNAAGGSRAGRAGFPWRLSEWAQSFLMRLRRRRTGRTSAAGDTASPRSLSDRWRVEDYYDPDPSVPDKTYSKIGAWVRGFTFDWKGFRIPPKVAAAHG